MDSTIPTQTLSEDHLHQQHHFKKAVSLAIQEDTDMFIVSKDKNLIPCHSFLLALFSPVVVRLMSGISCCSSPTIFLPDFPALPIKKLLHLLRSGQAILGKYVNIDIKIIKEIAEVLQISLIDLNLGPYVDNPLGVTFEIKKELSITKEIDSFDEEKKVINLKQESESYNEELEGQVKQAGKEPCEYIERDSWMTPVNFETIEIKMFPRNVKTILAAERDQKGDISTGKEPNEVIMESSNDMVIREAADVAFEGKQILNDWYEQAEESENMILGRNIDDKNNMIPDREQDLADQTKSSEDTDFQCFLCPITFTTSSQLRRHTKSHMGEKQFPRPVCSKLSSQIDSSNKLKKIHKKEELLKSNLIGDKPYQALLSSKKNSLQKKNNRDKFYKCDSCSKSFYSMGNLKQHNRTHTGDKPYHCVQCPQSFSRMADLKRHKMTHSGEKPHQCAQCSKSFSQLIHLKSHNVIHTGEKPHKCQQCPKAFSLLSNLKRHKKIHNGEKRD